MKQNKEPCRDPASEARNDWADAPYEVHCLRYNRVTGKMMTMIARSEEEKQEFFDHSKDHLDPNNLEGPGPTDEERRANARAISKLTVQERLELMFRGRQPNPVDNNPES